MRIGHGYDVHRFVKDDTRPLILGGVTVRTFDGLEGHSDADVLTHALIDSLLGAAGMGDIGAMFPDTDKVYKNISSLLLLEKVRLRLEERGYTVHNADCTVVAQSPKLAPFIRQMRDSIAAVLRVDADRINIKATTEEGLGFTGEGLGIAAHSVCLLEEIKIRGFVERKPDKNFNQL